MKISLPDQFVVVIASLKPKPQPRVPHPNRRCYLMMTTMGFGVVSLRLLWRRNGMVDDCGSEMIAYQS